MKQRPALLSIPHPCSQSWHTMASATNGRFCTHCAKTVINFADKTDAELLEQLTHASGRICGRFTMQQLNRPLLPLPSPGKGNAFYRFLTGLFLLGTVRESAMAQKTAPSPPPAIHDVWAGNKPSAQTDTSLAGKKVLVMQGTIYEKGTKILLPGVHVFAPGNQLLAVTNDSGSFSLSLPETQLSETLTFRFVFIGFIMTEVRIPKSALPVQRYIYLEPDQTTLLGEVVIINRKRKWWEFRWRR